MSTGLPRSCLGHSFNASGCGGVSHLICRALKAPLELRSKLAAGIKAVILVGLHPAGDGTGQDPQPPVWQFHLKWCRDTRRINGRAQKSSSLSHTCTTATSRMQEPCISSSALISQPVSKHLSYFTSFFQHNHKNTVVSPHTAANATILLPAAPRTLTCTVTITAKCHLPLGCPQGFPGTGSKAAFPQPAFSERELQKQNSRERKKTPTLEARWSLFPLTGAASCSGSGVGADRLYPVSFVLCRSVLSLFVEALATS